MTFRFAGSDDCPVLAELNHQLIQDEGHRNRMTIAELEQRMRSWLSSEYRAVVFHENECLVAYALFREQSNEVYLRQFFVIRNHRRRGIGRRAMEMLRFQIWAKTKRLTVEALVTNKSAVAFWRAVGFSDYSLTLGILPGGYDV